MKKKNIWKHLLKTYLFEIIALLTAAIIFLLLLNSDFSRRLITGFTYFRPEYTFTLFVIFFVLTATLFWLMYMQARKKKLKSTKKLSSFAKTVEKSHTIREMSQTQTLFTTNTVFANEKNEMPKDIDKSNPNIIELYFEYEEKLNI